MTPARLGLCLALILAVPRLASSHEGLHERLEAVTAAIAKRPHDPRLYLQRAELQRAHGDPAGALADLEVAGLIDPALAEVHLSAGHVFLDQGNLALAEQAALRFLERRPGAPEGLFLFAEVAIGGGAVEEGLRAYAAGLGLHPDPDAYLRRAELLTALGGARCAEALSGLEQGLVRLGPVPGLVAAAVELECALGRHDDALARLDALLARAARKETWLARRGDVLLLAGRAEDARGAYSEALGALRGLGPKPRNTAATRALEQRLERSLASLPEPRLAPPGTLQELE